MAAIKYSTEKKDLAEAYHLQGTLFKDLNQLSEAVEVQLCNRFHALYNYSNHVTLIVAAVLMKVNYLTVYSSCPGISHFKRFSTIDQLCQ